jgi:putative endonuclease
MRREYSVYIMTGRCGTFYVGVTNNIYRRVAEHKAGLSEFTARYRLHRLVYVESTDDVWSALAREKQLKPWRREKKIRLIRTMNPRFLDLAAEWPHVEAAALGRSRLPDKRGRPRRDGSLHSAALRSG